MKQKTLEEAKCVNGCKHYYGGEIRHHKDCFYYPESFSKMYDDLERQQERSYSEEEVFTLLMDFWKEEKPGFKTNPVCVSNWFEQYKKK